MAQNLMLGANNDLIIGRGAARVKGLAYTAQLVKNKLLTVLGEWEANPTLGLPWFAEIMIKTTDLSLVEGLIITCIKSTPHVLDVSSITLSLQNSTRVLTVAYEAISDWGLFADTVAQTTGGS
mgnify:CR=1 FL=1